jgi:hypothetical protein
MSSTQAIELARASTVLDVVVVPAEKKKNDAKGGKGAVHNLFTRSSTGTNEGIVIQMPRCTTFGARKNMYNSGPVAKYGVTLKFRMDQNGTVVEPLRAVHELIKARLSGPMFVKILPKTTKQMLKDMHKKKKAFPVDLFEREFSVDDEPMRAEFFALAREQVDRIAIFGGSEEDAPDQEGKAKMVSFSDGISKKDGKVFDRAWMVNLSASTKMKKAGEVLYNADPETGEPMRHAPVFDFTVCEGPEHDFGAAVEIPNDKILSRFSPSNGEPFTREGVAVVSLPYIHVNETEAQISVNMSLEHFHAFARDQNGPTKRKFSVISDPDTPQELELAVPLAEDSGEDVDVEEGELERE